MNTIDDLRASLRGHADDIGLPPGEAFSAAVQERVAGVRRRRRAGVAGAAAVVLAVVGGVILLPHRNQPDPAAQRQLAGHLAPKTIDSLGYTFAFAGGTEGADRVAYAFSADAGPRLLTWAAADPAVASLSAEDVDLNGDGVMPDESPLLAADFSDFLLIRPGESGRIELTGAGEVAFAVYALDRPAPGETQGDLTFRRDLPGWTLDSASFGQPGQSEVTFTFTVPNGVFSLDLYCQGGGGGAARLAGLWLNGRLLEESGSCPEPGQVYDAGTGGHYYAGPLEIDGKRYVAGDTVRVTARLLRKRGDSAATSDPRGLLALGVYRQNGRDSKVQEVGGHRYSPLPQRVTAVARGRTLRFSVPPSDGPVLMKPTLPESGFRAWELVVDGRVAARHETAVPMAVTLTTAPLMPWQDRTVTLRLVEGSMPAVPVRAQILVRID